MPQRKTRRVIGAAMSNLEALSRGELTPTVEPSPLELAHRAELERFILNLQASLSRRQKQMLFLKYYCDRTFPEIGELMGISEQAAQMLDTRVRRQLKKDLALRGVESARQIL